MAVGKDGHVAGRGPDLGDHPVDPAPHVLDRLTAGHAVVPEGPPRPLGEDVFGRPALVHAVVPLGQVVTDLSNLAETGKLAGLKGTLPRAHQDFGELPSLEETAKRHRLLAPALRQRHVRPARVAALERPLGLTVADKDYLLAVKGVFAHAVRLPRPAPPAGGSSPGRVLS